MHSRYKNLQKVRGRQLLWNVWGSLKLKNIFPLQYCWSATFKCHRSVGIRVISLGGELGRNSPRVVHSFTARLRNVYGSRGDRLQRIAIDQGQPWSGGWGAQGVACRPEKKVECNLKDCDFIAAGSVKPVCRIIR